VHLRQRHGQRSRVKAPLGPVGALPEVGTAAWGLFGKHAAIMRHIRRYLCGEYGIYSPQPADQPARHAYRAGIANQEKICPTTLRLPVDCHASLRRTKDGFAHLSGV
jgi:hypothetical protein